MNIRIRRSPPCLKPGKGFRHRAKGVLSHRRSWLTLAILLVPCITSVGNSDCLIGATYRSAASEVRISFFATDERNRSVESLDKGDFAVVDNGVVVRDFRSLSRSGETKLDLVAVVDSSESVASRFKVGVHDVLQLLSQEQLVSDDSISVLSFSGIQPGVICSGNCRDAVAETKLLSLQAGGATPLFDTLAFGADFISHRRVPGVKPVLILFSDGDDTISRTPAGDALEALVASDALIYSVDLGDPGKSSEGSSILQRMSDATGGRYFPIREGAANVLKAAIDDLHASYVVTYQLPSHQVGVHSLRILPTHNLNLKFHCRNGYHYENNIR